MVCYDSSNCYTKQHYHDKPIRRIIVYISGRPVNIGYYINGGHYDRNNHILTVIVKGSVMTSKLRKHFPALQNAILSVIFAACIVCSAYLKTSNIVDVYSVHAKRSNTTVLPLRSFIVAIMS